MTAFVSAKPNLKNQNLNIWEFMPLPGDPSEKDLKEMQEEQAKEAQKQLDGAIQMYRQMGIELNDIKFTA